MVIESSNNSHSQRTVSPSEQSGDTHAFSNVLRPMKLEDYVGQKRIKKHLDVSIRSSKMRKRPLEHILFYGPP
jgi:Holliday junction DNA helicase RuvB